MCMYVYMRYICIVCILYINLMRYIHHLGIHQKCPHVDMIRLLRIRVYVIRVFLEIYIFIVYILDRRAHGFSLVW